MLDNALTQVQHLHNKSAPQMVSFTGRGGNIEQHSKVVSLNNLVSGLLKIKERGGGGEMC